MNFVDSMFCKLITAVRFVKKDIASFAKEDDGDTNFLSIFIILGIVLALAVIFIGFKDRIVTFVEKKMDDLFNRV